MAKVQSAIAYRTYTAQIKNEQKNFLFIVMFIFFYIIEIVSFNLYTYTRTHMHHIVCINLIIQNLFKRERKKIMKRLSQKRIVIFKRNKKCYFCR